MLAKLQRTSPSQPIAYSTWKDKCIEKMSVSADGALRRILTELTDHGAVEYKRDEETRAEVVRIPHADAVVRQILQFKRQS